MYQTWNQMPYTHCILLRNPGKSPWQPSKFGITVSLLQMRKHRLREVRLESGRGQDSNTNIVHGLLSTTLLLGAEYGFPCHSELRQKHC